MDGQTAGRYIHPALHTMWAVPISLLLLRVLHYFTTSPTLKESHRKFTTNFSNSNSKVSTTTNATTTTTTTTHV